MNEATQTKAHILVVDDEDGISWEMRSELPDIQYRQQQMACLH
jgi:DNA-binding NtrC family response regulator